MSTLMGEKIKAAMDKKLTDINTFIWKGNKVLDESGKYRQSEKKLVSMSEYELNECYDHCKTMLFNKDVQNPGRYVVLESIAEQKDRCGAELFLRYLEQEKSLGRFTLLESINEFQKNNREVLKTLPPFAKDYFRAMEPKSSAKTRINYAYDIRVFFHFLLENNLI